MTPLIETRKVTKEYRGVPAIREVDFDLARGEIHALVGENGAGKSTLTKILAGVTQPTSGQMLVDGEPTVYRTPAEALRHGVNMVFQENSLVPSMTVAQNLYLGEAKFFNRLRGIYIAAQQFLASLNFNVDPWATVATLGAAKKQMVEIARAVHHNARVIVFDEPTASLTPEEKHHFFALVRRLKERGVSIIFISHALEEALELSDRITIMRDGEGVVTDATSTFDRDRIIRAMVGRSLTDRLYDRRGGRGTRKQGEKVLSVQNLSLGKMVRNTSFTIYAGQITGIFGLIGSGRTETAKIVSGALKRTSSMAAKFVLATDRSDIACHARRCGTASSTSPRTERWRASLRPCPLPRISMSGVSLRRRKAASSSISVKCSTSPPLGAGSSASRRSTTMPASLNCRAAINRRW